MHEQERCPQHPEVFQKIRTLTAQFAQTYPRRDADREFPHEEVNALKTAGLMAMTVPESYGGLGLPFDEVTECLMTLAEGNPSVSQIFFVHGTMVLTLLEWATEAQKQRLFGEVVKDQTFLGQAFSERHSKNVLSWDTVFHQDPNNGGLHISGKKFFTTGSLASDYFMVGGMLDQQIRAAMVTKDTPGVVIHNDWNAMGQRGTASGSMTLENVRIDSDLLLPSLQTEQPDPSSLLGLVYQTGFSAIYVGTARGALKKAVEYTRTKTRPWPDSGVDTATEDPYILHTVGHMQAYLSAAENLVRKAAKLVAEAFSVRGTVDQDEMTRLRAEAAIAVSEAKLVSTEVALRICQDIFQVCGARSAMAEEDLDRFWRDVRTLTLHDPKDYKAKLIGEYLLLDKPPTIGLYS